MHISNNQHRHIGNRHGKARTLRLGAGLLRPVNVNVASLLAMFGAMLGEDAVTDRYGAHRLADFFAELAR